MRSPKRTPIVARVFGCVNGERKAAIGPLRCKKPGDLGR